MACNSRPATLWGVAGTRYLSDVPAGSASGPAVTYFSGVLVGVGVGVTGLYAARGGAGTGLAAAFFGFFFSRPRASRLPMAVLLLD